MIMIIMIMINNNNNNLGEIIPPWHFVAGARHWFYLSWNDISRGLKK